MTTNHPLELPVNEPTSHPKLTTATRTAIYTILASVTVVGLLSALLTYFITPPGL